MLIKSNRATLQSYKVEERTFGTPCTLYLLAWEAGMRNMGREILCDARKGKAHVCSRPSSWSEAPFLFAHTSNLLGHLLFSAGWLLPKSEINLMQKGMNGIKEEILFNIKVDFDGFIKAKCLLWKCNTLLPLAFVSVNIKANFCSVVSSASIFSNC